MARKLLPDDLWAVIEPLLPPPPPPGPRGGRPRLGDRQALTGILFVLRTGLPWEDRPAELGCGCGLSCWRRLRDWQADGTWTRLHAELLARLHAAGKLDWSKCVIDSSSVRAVFGGPPPARTPRTGARRAASTTS
jgi:transposase